MVPGFCALLRLRDMVGVSPVPLACFASAPAAMLGRLIEAGVVCFFKASAGFSRPL